MGRMLEATIKDITYKVGDIIVPLPNHPYGNVNGRYRLVDIISDCGQIFFSGDSLDGYNDFQGSYHFRFKQYKKSNLEMY